MGYFDGVPMIAGNDYSSGLKYLGGGLDQIAAGQDAEKRRRDLLRQQAIENARKAEETRIKDEREKDWDLRNKRADNQRQADRNVRVTKDITTAVGRGGVTAGEAEAEANRYTDPETGKTVGAQFIAGVPEINDHLDMRPPEADPAATGLAGMLGNKGPASHLSLTGQKPPEASQHMTLGGPDEPGPDEPGPDGAMPPGGSADVPQWQKSFAQQLNGPAGATPDSVRADQYGENMKKDAAAEHRHAIQFDTGHKVFLDPHETERAAAEKRAEEAAKLRAMITPQTNLHDANAIRRQADMLEAGVQSTGAAGAGITNQTMAEDAWGHKDSQLDKTLTNRTENARLVGARGPRPPSATAVGQLELAQRKAFEAANKDWEAGSGTKALTAMRDQLAVAGDQLAAHQADPTNTIAYNASLVSTARSIHRVGVLTEPDYQHVVGNTRGWFDGLINKIDQQQNGQPDPEQAATLARYIAGSKAAFKGHAIAEIKNFDRKFGHSAHAELVPGEVASARDALMDRFGITEEDIHPEDAKGGGPGAPATAPRPAGGLGSSPAEDRPASRPGTHPMEGQRQKAADGIFYVVRNGAWVPE